MGYARKLENEALSVVRSQRALSICGVPCLPPLAFLRRGSDLLRVAVWVAVGLCLGVSLSRCWFIALFDADADADPVDPAAVCERCLSDRAAMLLVATTAFTPQQGPSVLRHRARVSMSGVDLGQTFRRAEVWSSDTATLADVINVVGRWESCSEWRERTEFREDVQKDKLLFFEDPVQPYTRDKYEMSVRLGSACRVRVRAWARARATVGIRVMVRVRVRVGVRVRVRVGVGVRVRVSVA